MEKMRFFDFLDHLNKEGHVAESFETALQSFFIGIKKPDDFLLFAGILYPCCAPSPHYCTLNGERVRVRGGTTCVQAAAPHPNLLPMKNGEREK